jgi:hypothetical protein
VPAPRPFALSISDLLRRFITGKRALHGRREHLDLANDAVVRAFLPRLRPDPEDLRGATGVGVRGHERATVEAEGGATPLRRDGDRHAGRGPEEAWHRALPSWHGRGESRGTLVLRSEGRNESVHTLLALNSRKSGRLFGECVCK